MIANDLYFSDLMEWWRLHATDLLPLSRLYLGRAPQDIDTTNDYATIEPLPSDEPLEDTGDIIIETLSFFIHLHGRTDSVVQLGRKLNKRLSLEPISDNTLELQRTSRRYIREPTDLHHFIMKFDWTRQFDETPEAV